MGDDDPKALLKGTWWFPLRRHLPGWGLPVCWQGWAVVGVYLALLVAPAPFLHGRFAFYHVAYAVLLTAGFLAVVATKGEPHR